MYRAIIYLFISFIIIHSCATTRNIFVYKDQKPITEPKIINLNEDCKPFLDEFYKEINEKNHCKKDSDCSAIRRGSHYGCYLYFNKDYESYFKKKVDEHDSVCRSEMLLLGSCLHLEIICSDNGRCTGI